MLREPLTASSGEGSIGGASRRREPRPLRDGDAVVDMLHALIPLLIKLSLAGLVLAVGMHAAPGDLLYVMRRPRLLAPATLAVVILPPIMAGLLVWALPLEPVVKAGIMLMAISPVPPLVPGKEIAIGGRRSYAYGLYVAMALLTIVSVPALLAVITPLFGRQDFISVGAIARSVAIGVLAPLALGVVIRQVAPPFAAKTWSLIYKLSMLMILVAVVPVIAKNWGQIADLIGNGAVLAMAAVSAISLAIGHLLGGPDIGDRAALAIAASVRHPGISMSIVATSIHDARVAAAVLLFMLVGLIVSIPYAAWIKRRRLVSARAPSS